MARITVEDCVIKIPNKFELVVLTGQRVRELVSGAKATVQAKNKEIVIALREVAEGKVSPPLLREALIGKYQTKRQVEQDDPYNTTEDEFGNEDAWRSFNDSASGVEQGAGTIEPDLDLIDESDEIDDAESQGKGLFDDADPETKD